MYCLHAISHLSYLALACVSRGNSVGLVTSVRYLLILQCSNSIRDQVFMLLIPRKNDRFIVMMFVSFNSTTTGVTCSTGTADISDSVHPFVLCIICSFLGVFLSLFFLLFFCSFCHCIVCVSSIYHF